jgi:PKD repeat protein
MTACPSHKSPGRISSGTTLVIPKITAFTALLLIALVCITIPVGATDAQNSTATSTGVPVGNLSVDEPIGNSTPTGTSLASLDTPTATVPARHVAAGDPENPVENTGPDVMSAGMLTAPAAVLEANDPNAVTSPVEVAAREDRLVLSPVGSGLVAAFSATPGSEGYPLKVQFTDQSTGDPDRWSWYFGEMRQIRSLGGNQPPCCQDVRSTPASPCLMAVLS